MILNSNIFSSKVGNNNYFSYTYSYLGLWKLEWFHVIHVFYDGYTNDIFHNE